MDNQEQDFGGLPVLKKSDVSSKSEVTSEDFGGLPVLTTKDFRFLLEKYLPLRNYHQNLQALLKRGLIQIFQKLKK